MRSIQAALFALLTIFFFFPRIDAAREMGRYTLQVAAFSDGDSARQFAESLERERERPVRGTVDLPGRGRWTRVFVGSFKTAAEARRYGEALVARGLIKGFIIKPAAEIKQLGRPRSADRNQASEALSGAMRGTASESPRMPTSLEIAARSSDNRAAPSTRTQELPGPVTREPKLAFVPPIETSLVPTGNPVRLALDSLATARRGDGGLWITGDVLEGCARLRWIVGPEDADSIKVGGDGRVGLDEDSIAKSAGVTRVHPGVAPLMVADHILANEGLLLLVQLIQGGHRYLLHVGHSAPTAAGEVAVTGSINLDNNFDSRINLIRRSRNKLRRELPPEGFDSMVAINPEARWLNLPTSRMIPVGLITFHELAEAHAKLEMGLDYLGRGSQPGAHDVAMEREAELKAQRPRSDVVVTLGTNRVFTSEEGVRQLGAVGPSGHHR